MQSQAERLSKDNISRLLDARESNPLKDFLYGDAAESLGWGQTEESRYRHYVVETQPGGQREIYELREYREGEFASIASRPTFRFRWKCKRLLEQAEPLAALSDENRLEFEYRVTLLWADIASLSEHLGSAAEVDQLITALHVAYAQHIKRMTPKPVIEALVSLFRIVDRYTRLPVEAVDEALDGLEKAGVDLNYPMAFGDTDA